MASLTEVYDGNGGEASSHRRLYAGTVLVIAGVGLAALAVIVATTDPFAGVVDSEFVPVMWAGIMAGVGVPTALVGAFVVLPSSRRTKAAVTIGLTICLLGVALFWHAYPRHWNGHGDDLTLLVSAVYLLGLLVAIWCLFTAVANFRTRSDPGGALEMNVTRTEETRVVEVEQPGGLGSVGLFGSTPDGEDETQTNESGATASDGGAAIVDGRASALTDRYCGNCRHFEYVRTSAGMTPYCTHYDDAMDDMDACEEWTSNHE